MDPRLILDADVPFQRTENHLQKLRMEAIVMIQEKQKETFRGGYRNRLKGRLRSLVWACDSPRSLLGDLLAADKADSHLHSHTRSAQPASADLLPKHTE